MLTGYKIDPVIAGLGLHRVDILQFQAGPANVRILIFMQ